MGCLSAVLEQLGLPAEQQVKLLMVLIKCFPSPSQMPDFLKRRRKQSRATVIDDLVRPVRSDAERALFIECYQLHTKHRHTYWLGFTREFNIRVCEVWERGKYTCQLYLKREGHLKQYKEDFMLQASQAEVNQISSAISGLPATESLVSQAPMQLRPPGASDILQHQGHGRGGKDGLRQCRMCERALHVSVPQMGQRCLEYLIVHGHDPHKYEYVSKEVTKRNGRLPTVEEAQATLNAALQ